MRHYDEKRAGGIVTFSAVIFAFASFLAPQPAAQQPGRGETTSAADRVRQRQIRRNDQMETDLLISTLKRESRRPAEEDRQRLAYTQIKEDFERLQTVNNQMMVTTFADNVLDYRRISDASAEIRKRASRLMSNLPLPGSGKEEQTPTTLKGWDELDRGQVKPALLTLDDLIMAFVNNPVFQTPEIVDVQQSAKARNDLEAVIKLSGKIKKSTERLLKNEPK